MDLQCVRYVHRRGFFAAVCGSFFFALILVPGFAKGPPDLLGWIACAVCYLLFSSLLYWLFARRRAADGPASARQSFNRFGPLVKAIAALCAGPLISFGFWALEVYVVSPEFYLTPYERNETLPGFLMVGTFIGFLVSALAVAFERG